LQNSIEVVAMGFHRGIFLQPLGYGQERLQATNFPKRSPEALVAMHLRHEPCQSLFVLFLLLELPLYASALESIAVDISCAYDLSRLCNKTFQT
jgi:hypothetical protein